MPILLYRTGHEAEHRSDREGTSAGSVPGEILIVPTRRRVRHLLRDSLLARREIAATPLPFQTLETFADALYGALPAVRPHISRPFRTFLFAQAVRQARTQLRFFTPRTREPYIFPGTFDRIVATVVGLRDAGFASAQLEAELQAETSGEEQAKLHDLALLARRYEESLDAYGLQDEAGVMRLLGEDLPEEELGSLLALEFPGVRRILFDGFDQFSEPEIRFIERLARVRGINVALSLDYLPENLELFGQLSPLIKRLRESGFTTQEAAASPLGRPVDLLAPFLFRPGSAVSPTVQTERIVVARAPDRYREVIMICRMIKDAVLAGWATDMSRICVAMRDLDRYTDIMRETFPRYGIPVNMTQGFALSRSPLVVDILALLEVRTFGFRREDILRIAGSPFFRFTAKGNINAANLAAEASRLRFAGGEQGWHEALRKRVLRLPTLAARADDPDAYLASERSKLEKADADFRAIVQSTSTLAGMQTPEEFRTRTLRLLETLQVPAVLEGIADVSLQEREARAYEVLRNLIEGMTSFHRRGGASRARPLSYYVEQLRLAVGRERFNIRERAGWGVLVTAIEEIRGLSFDLLILAGMVDGELPAAFSPDLFLDARRRQQREERHLFQERYLFYQALACWQGRLYLTSPQREGDVDLVESPFVVALRSVVQVHEGDPTPHDTVFTAAEFLSRIRGETPFVSPLPEWLQNLAAETTRIRRIEESRRSTHVLPEYEGILKGHLSGRAQARLLHLREEVFSVSQLEEYGNCPFRFLMTRLLQLQLPELFVEEVTAAERGAVIHEVLFSFFLDRRTRGLPPLHLLKDQEFEKAIEEMRQIARRILERLDIPDLFWEFEQERILGVPGRRKGLLRAFLEAERERTDTVRPLYFEAAFGRGKRVDPTDPQMTVARPVQAGRVALKGKVDRIDGNDRCYTVIDYKTGAGIPSMEEIRSGESLQLPLYLHVVDQLLQAAGKQCAPAGGLYYQVRNPVRFRLGIGSAEWSGEAFPASAGRRRLVRSEAELREVIATAIRRAELYVDAMVRGEFPVVPAGANGVGCSTCDLSAICRSQTMARGSSQPQEET